MQPVRSSSLRPAEEYAVIERIAEGGVCEVYRGRHLATGTVVALKFLRADVKHTEVIRRRFEQEYTAAYRLDHPNIVRVLDFCDAEKNPYLVMELVEGPSLAELVQRRRHLPEGEAIRLIVQACRGLHYAHQHGLIHRDIKPENLLLTPDGVVKIADLGLAKELLDDQNLTQPGRGLGTPHYMAPEQFSDAKGVDVRADVYSVAATLYTLLSGRTPFGKCTLREMWLKKSRGQITPLRAIVRGLTAGTDELIQRAMSYDPEARPASCAEFVRELTGRPLDTETETDPSADAEAAWFLHYQDAHGEVYVLRRSAEQIRHSVAGGQLQNARGILVAQKADGPFQPLGSWPEFCDLAPEPQPEPRPAHDRDDHPTPAPDDAGDGSPSVPRWTWVGVGLVALLSALACAVLFRR
jgi:serine/threonine protein kinase